MISCLLIKISNCDTQYIYNKPQIDGQTLEPRSNGSKLSPKNVPTKIVLKNSENIVKSDKIPNMKTSKKNYYCKNNVGQIVPCSKEQDEQGPTFYG